MPLRNWNARDLEKSLQNEQKKLQDEQKKLAELQSHKGDSTAEVEPPAEARAKDSAKGILVGLKRPKKKIKQDSKVGFV